MTHYLQEYTRFKNNKDLHAATKKHTALHYAQLNKSDRLVLEAIQSCSAMHGTAHLTYEELMRATGKSNATVRRAIRKLVTLGIIQKAHYFNPVTGGLGANIYTILPFMTGNNPACTATLNLKGEKTND